MHYILVFPVYAIFIKESVSAQIIVNAYSIVSLDVVVLLES